jgi:hypothetical protein
VILVVNSTFIFVTDSWLVVLHPFASTADSRVKVCSPVNLGVGDQSSYLGQSPASFAGSLCLPLSARSPLPKTWATCGGLALSKYSRVGASGFRGGSLGTVHQ